MSSGEHQELRRLLVAFGDAATWCEDLAQQTRQVVGKIQRQEDVDATEIEACLGLVERTLRYLESHRQEVARLRVRVGLSGPDDASPDRQDAT